MWSPVSHPHAEVIERFYSAFQELDAETMASCYHPEIHFSDPAFPDLEGRDAGDMWRMLCSRAKDFRLEYSQVKGDDAGGAAHWDAYYTFSATGRSVVNRIDAKFTFRDGLIVRHVDDFDFWTWSKQALGAPGLLLGWAGFFQRKVQATARGNLTSWQARQA